MVRSRNPNFGGGPLMQLLSQGKNKPTQMNPLPQDTGPNIENKKYSLRELTRFNANRFMPTFNQSGGQAFDQAFGTLNQLLGLQGATDPTLMNRDLADIAKSNQAMQDAFQGRLAGSNMQRSGVGQMFGSAIDQAGLERRADRIAQETAQQEQRKREDLMLFLNMVLNPQLQMMGQSLGVPAGGPSDLESLLGASGGILSGIAAF